ncbi:HEPN domain-containing protein [Porticoccus sp.]
MDELVLKNEFARRSFRDVADQDYVAARLSHRAQLREPFLWSALQAVEKYFKAILLFNDKSSKGVGHDLHEAMRRIEVISDIGFKLPQDVREFVLYLDKFGENRYLEYSAHLKPHALMELDRCIWHIRKYCFYMRGTAKSSSGKIIDLFPLNVAKINEGSYEETPHKYQILGGYLEGLIKENKPASESLIWNNFYFGRRRRKQIKNYNWNWNYTNSFLSMHPDAFKQLDGLVQFSKSTKEFFKKRTN